MAHGNPHKRDIKISLNLNREEYGMVQYIMKVAKHPNRNEAIRWAIREIYTDLITGRRKPPVVANGEV